MLDSYPGHFSTRRLDRGHSKRHRIQSCDRSCAIRKCQRGAPPRKRNRPCFLYATDHPPVPAGRVVAPAGDSFLSRQYSLVRCPEPTCRRTVGSIRRPRQGADACSRRRGSSARREHENGTFEPSRVVVWRISSFALPNPWNLEMGGDDHLPLCGNIIFVVCPPANDRMGVAGGETPPICGP